MNERPLKDWLTKAAVSRLCGIPAAKVSHFARIGLLEERVAIEGLPAKFSLASARRLRGLIVTGSVAIEAAKLEPAAASA